MIFIASAIGWGIFIWGILLPDFRRVALFLQPFQLRFCRLYMTVLHRPLILR